MKGINAWCFPGGYSFEQVLDLAAEAGFETLEPNFYGEGPISFGTTAAEAAAMADKARARGLRITSLSTGMFWQYPLTSPDEGVRGMGKSVVRRMLSIAADMGADTILVVPGVVDENTTYRQAWDRSLEALRGLSADAGAAGVSIGVENVWNKFLLSPLEYVSFLDAVGSEWVGSYFDVGNVLVNGYPEQWIAEIGHRLRKVHVKDFSRNIGNGSGFLPLLQGDVAWDRVAKALASVGYDGPLTAELSPYNTFPEKLVLDTADNIGKIISLSL